MANPLTTCPNCGKELHYEAQVDANIAPWVCDDCVRSWWPSELLPQYRDKWNSNNRDFGNKSAEVTGKVKEDVAAAVKAKREAEEHGRP